MAGRMAEGSIAPSTFRVAALVAILLCFASSPSPAAADVKEAVKRWLEGASRWIVWVEEASSTNSKSPTDLDNDLNVDLDGKLWLAQKRERVVTVSQDGESDFGTVNDALKSVPSGNKQRVVIKIEPGTYQEKIVINNLKPFVTLLGDPEDMPTISFQGETDAVVKVEADYFVAANIIFEATHGSAMEISGDKAAFFGCEFHGVRDTLFDVKGSHFFKDCYISGAGDFIFGSAKSMYSKCTFNVTEVPKGLREIRERTAWKDDSGFAFVSCEVEGSAKVKWTPSARIVFANSHLGVTIKPIGWNDDGPDSDKLGVYGYYRCEGLGAVEEDYVKIIDDKQAKPFLTTAFIHGSSWLLQPPSYDD